MKELSHTGFCLGEYDKDLCSDCPTEKECLELGEKERRGMAQSAIAETLINVVV